MKLGRMKIPAELLKDPNPKLAAKMRRAASAMGRAARATMIQESGATRIQRSEQTPIPAALGEPRHPTAHDAGEGAGSTFPDPTCPTACGRCHWCLRAKYGPDYPFTMPHATPPDRRRR